MLKLDKLSFTVNPHSSLMVSQVNELVDPATGQVFTVVQKNIAIVIPPAKDTGEEVEEAKDMAKLLASAPKLYQLLKESLPSIKDGSLRAEITKVLESI